MNNETKQQTNLEVDDEKNASQIWTLPFDF